MTTTTGTGGTRVTGGTGGTNGAAGAGGGWSWSMGVRVDGDRRCDMAFYMAAARTPTPLHVTKIRSSFT